MLVALAVIEKRPLAGRILDVLLGQGRALGLGGRVRELEHLGPARASPPARAASRSTSVKLRVERCRPAPEDLDELVVGERQSSMTVHRESSAAFTSKYGFSVVAPISVIRPSSTACSTVLLRLVERWISSMKRIVLVVAAEPVARPCDHGPHVVDASRDGRDLLERSSRPRGDDARDRRLPGARWPEQDHRRLPVVLDRSAQRRAGPEHVLLADEIVERRRAQRTASGAFSACRSRAASEKRSATREVCSRPMSRRDEVALLQALPPAATNPPGNETQSRRASSYLAQARRGVRALRPRGAPREPRRPDQGRRRSVPRVPVPYRHRVARTPPSGSAIPGRVSSSTARSGGAARST